MPFTSVIPLPVHKSDNTDQQRQKINMLRQNVFDLTNAGSVQLWIAQGNPINNGDTLIYDFNSSVFRNVLLTTLIQTYLDAHGYKPDSKIRRFYFANYNEIY